MVAPWSFEEENGFQMTDAETQDANGPADPGVAEAAAAPAGPEGAVAGTTDELQADIAAVNDRLLRLQADFDNFRKRTARDRAEQHLRALEDLMRELLPVVDHFEMGLATATKQGIDPSVRQGFGLVLDQFRGVLARFGLAPVEAVGTSFDPHVHESVAMIPSEQHPRDTVVEETRRGYTLGGRLLRAAQVVVSSGPAVGASAEAPDA